MTATILETHRTPPKGSDERLVGPAPAASAEEQINAIRRARDLAHAKLQDSTQELRTAKEWIEILKETNASLLRRLEAAEAKKARVLPPLYGQAELENAFMRERTILNGQIKDLRENLRRLQTERDHLEQAGKVTRDLKFETNFGPTPAAAVVSENAMLKVVLAEREQDIKVLSERVEEYRFAANELAQSLQAARAEIVEIAVDLARARGQLASASQPNP